MLDIIASLNIIEKQFGNADFMIIVTRAGNYHEISHYHNEEFDAKCYTVNDEIGVGIESFNREDITKYINDME